MKNNFYTEEELQALGFISVGNNVKISKRASLYKPELMTIGSNVRIEDFCIVNGSVTIGNDVMICSFCLLDGHSGINIGDNVTLATKVSIHSGSDDYSGESLFGCFAPRGFRFNHNKGTVSIKNHVLIGDSAIIMPNLTIAEGTAVGAASFIKGDTKEWSIYAGQPARKLKDRSRAVIELYNQSLLKK